jgi:micrococcal nuclease
MPVPPVVPVMPPTGVPPSVPVPATVSALPVSSGGMAPAAAPSSRAANSHLWRVVKVYDGDTVTCLDDMNQQQKVRLAGIDAPEAGQDFGQVSRQALAGMVFGKTIEVVDDGRDRYGRWVGRLYTDGIDVNQQMVATGNAWHYAAYSNDQTLAALQSQAQSQRIGLWSQANPVPPWVFRQNGDPS